MKLSAPIYRLKRDAKRLSRDANIPLHLALDRVAAGEGFPRWGLLAASHAATGPAARIFPRLAHGDLLLVAARPGHGKTLMSLGCCVEAMKLGHRAIIFTLEDTRADVIRRLHAIGADPDRFSDLLEIDCSDALNADHMIARLATAPRGTFAVVDYLQLLDQRRDNPDLMAQIREIRSFARANGIVFVFVSQIDRSYDPGLKPCPGLDDVRLPNPLDLSLFDKSCFLHEGEVRFQVAA